MFVHSEPRTREHTNIKPKGFEKIKLCGRKSRVRSDLSMLSISFARPDAFSIIPLPNKVSEFFVEQTYSLYTLIDGGDERGDEPSCTSSG